MRSIGKDNLALTNFLTCNNILIRLQIFFLFKQGLHMIHFVAEYCLTNANAFFPHAKMLIATFRENYWKVIDYEQNTNK